MGIPDCAKEHGTYASHARGTAGHRGVYLVYTSAHEVMCKRNHHCSSPFPLGYSQKWDLSISSVITPSDLFFHERPCVSIIKRPWNHIKIGGVRYNTRCETMGKAFTSKKKLQVDRNRDNSDGGMDGTR